MFETETKHNIKLHSRFIHDLSGKITLEGRFL